MNAHPVDNGVLADNPQVRAHRHARLSPGKSQGCGPSDPQDAWRSMLGMDGEHTFHGHRLEAALRVAAARDHLTHGLAGDWPLEDAMTACELMLREAARWLRRAAA